MLARVLPCMHIRFSIAQRALELYTFLRPRDRETRNRKYKGDHPENLIIVYRGQMKMRVQDFRF